MSMIQYTNTLALADALWWFIENVDFENPERSELFFRLRERMRTEGTAMDSLLNDMQAIRNALDSGADNASVCGQIDWIVNAALARVGGAK